MKKCFCFIFKLEYNPIWHPFRHITFCLHRLHMLHYRDYHAWDYLKERKRETEREKERQRDKARETKRD